MSRCISADPVVLVLPVAGVVSLGPFHACGCADAVLNREETRPHGIFVFLPVPFYFSLYCSALRFVCTVRISSTPSPHAQVDINVQAYLSLSLGPPA